MNHPRLSVILPAYNAERYLREAIGSILQQTFTDFELLVLNDGSVDSTEQVVLEFDDPRIVYVCNEQNIGLANTINKGLALAKGELIARMDADDISLPTRLETQVCYLDEHPEVMLCSCALLQFGAAQRQMIGPNDFEQVKVNMLFASAIGHASSVWRKDFFTKNRLAFRQEEFPAEDYGLWTRAVFCGKMVNIPDVLYCYRIYPEQVTATDFRATEKCMQIRRNYILRLCPSVPENYIQAFLAADHGITNYAHWRDCVAFVRYMCKHTATISRSNLHHTLYGFLSQLSKCGIRGVESSCIVIGMRMIGIYYRIVKYIPVR